MKKVLIALFTAAMIFLGSMVTPVTVFAAENDSCVHTFNATYQGFYTRHTQHTFSGSTCNISLVFYGTYPRCTKCGYIDYSVTSDEVLRREDHDLCGIHITYN